MTRDKQALILAACLTGLAWHHQRRRYSFADKVVLVTGGSRGLGLELCRAFAAERARVIFCARSPADVARAQSELRTIWPRVEGIVCDVTDRKQVAVMIADIVRLYGHIDVLVNNAGIIQATPIEHATLEDFEAAMETHFWAPLYLMRAVLPFMRKRSSGRIVNIASIGGKMSVPHLLPYCASKFALVGLSSGMASQLRKNGIYVTTVCPGLMRTGSPRNATFKGQNRAEYAWFSIGSSLPGLTMNSRRAAKKIVDACRQGRAEITLTLPAIAAAAAAQLLPGAMASVLGIVNRLLPGPGGIGNRSARGAESFSAVSPSWLTRLNEQAAERNLEVGAHWLRP